MNNVFFSNEGLTSTNANYYANIAKELQCEAQERLNEVKFFKTSVAVIGSNNKQVMSEGILHLTNINTDLQKLASLNTFCAWIREAIKEKEFQLNEVNKLSFEDWIEQQEINLPQFPVIPKEPKLITEIDVRNSWSKETQSRYFELEAYAATYGKYIHPDGAYSIARKNLHNTLNKPITKEGSGRDMVLYYTEPTVPISSVDDLFMKLQNSYRSYEKELNQMKAELKETVNNINRNSYTKHQIELGEYQAQLKDYKAIKESFRSEFLTWKTNESERISKLKITIPESLKDTFKMIQQIGDTSK